MKLTLLFSDLDGTCVHYQDGNDVFCADSEWSAIRLSDGRRTAVLTLPPTSSGARGMISVKTLELFAAVRALGTKLVLISGCRYSTLLERLPFLPAADAYVCESGGRIFYPNSTWPTAVALSEDLGWREHHVAAGPYGQDGLSAIDREGKLWDFYRALSAQNAVALDARSYTTAFRARVSKLAEEAPDELACAVNLGAVDVYPVTSGKKNAALHLMKHFGAMSDGSDSMFMCDDDNDIELATVVQRAYVPGITSDTMQTAISLNPSHFVVAREHKMWATEEILTEILKSIVQ